MNVNNEKREHKRYILPKENQITVILKSIEHETSVKAVLLNVSMGGIGMAATRGDQPNISKGAMMEIVGIDGPLALQSIGGEKVVIRWIMEHDAFDNICFGCEFKKLQEKAMADLQNFIANV